MRKFFTFLFLSFSTTLLFSQGPYDWDMIFQGNTTTGSTQYNYLEFGPDNKPYLLVSYGVAHEYDIRMKLMTLEDDQWVDLTEEIEPDIISHQTHYDFVVTANSEIYLGMDKRILKYDSENSNWQSFTAEGYCGGLTSDKDGTLYFMDKESGSPLYISKFEDGVITKLTEVEGLRNISPHLHHNANRITFVGDDVYVTAMEGTIRSLFFYKGNFEDGIYQFGGIEITGSSLQARVSIGSTAINSKGEAFAARSGATYGHTVIDKYNPETDDWVPFDTVGVNKRMNTIIQLQFDSEDNLYLINNKIGYDSEDFVYKYTESGWQELMSSDAMKGAMYKSWLTFDQDGVPHIILSNYFVKVFRMGGLVSNIHESVVDNDLLIYPNPASNWVTLKNISVGSQIKIYDIIGNLIYSTISTEDTTTIDVQGLNVGTYIVQITDKGSSVNKKLSIVHR